MTRAKSSRRRPPLQGGRGLSVIGCIWFGLLLLLLAAPAFAANRIQEVTSPGGITAWLVEDHSLPVVTLDVSFRGGAALDPADKVGLATFTTSLLDEGAGDYDSAAFQGRLEDLATSLEFGASMDAISVSLRTVTRNLAPALDLLRLSLTAPRFGNTEVERVRGELLASLARSAHEPRYIADRLWWRDMFGDHPYGRPVQGTPENIARIAVADMRQLVHDRLGRDVMLISVVGDVTPAALATLLDQTFGPLPAQAAPAPVPEAAPEPKKPLLSAKLPIPQSVVVFGEPGIKRDDPDWYAAFLVNHILGGGGLTSRLTQELREKRGLVYSVYSGLDPLAHGAVIYGSLATENSRVTRSIDLVRSEWRRMHDEGPTARELEDAKTYLTGSFPLSLDSTGAIAATLIAVQRDHLGITYLDRRNALINQVTLADAKRVARRLFDPDRLAFVVVGAPEHLVGAEEVPPGGS